MGSRERTPKGPVPVSEKLSPEMRALRAQLAAHTKWAKTPDASAATAPARKAFLARFDDEVDPDRVLPEAERARMAESARRAFYQSLAYKSAKAKRARRTLGSQDKTAGEAA
jgi:hypothetical protein